MSAKLALVGIEAFGQFCLDAFSKMPEIEIVAVCDLDKTRAEQFENQFSETNIVSVKAGY